MSNVRHQRRHVQPVLLSRPTISVTPNLTPRLWSEPGQLVLDLKAHRRLTVTEVQGSKELLAAFGAKRPESFAPRWFADDADVPGEMMEDVAYTNQTDFRWGCQIQMGKGATARVEIPATESPAGAMPLAIISVVYEYHLLFGLIRRKFAASIAVGSPRKADV